MACRYGDLPYRFGHPGDRYGIWVIAMGADSIDMVISYIDMGDLGTLVDTGSWNHQPRVNTEST